MYYFGIIGKETSSLKFYVKEFFDGISNVRQYSIMFHYVLICSTKFYLLRILNFLNFYRFFSKNKNYQNQKSNIYFYNKVIFDIISIYLLDKLILVNQNCFVEIENLWNQKNDKSVSCQFFLFVSWQKIIYSTKVIVFFTISFQSKIVSFFSSVFSFF